MSLNKYKPHLLVLPEDDANQQIANGFLKYSNLNNRVIQVLPEASGWRDVIEKFKNNYASTMRQYSARFIVLLIDFDNTVNRLEKINQDIPEDLKDRVFVIGVQSNPEDLKKSINKNFEGIGLNLANDCDDDTKELWSHQLLKHNQAELNRLNSNVKPFLFN